MADRGVNRSVAEFWRDKNLYTQQWRDDLLDDLGRWRANEGLTYGGPRVPA